MKYNLGRITLLTKTLYLYSRSHKLHNREKEGGERRQGCKARQR